MLQDIVDRFCKHSYTLGLLLAALTFALVPLHQLSLERGNVVRVGDDNTVRVQVSDLPSAHVGEVIPVYRFNPGWMRPIGQAEVVAQDGEYWALSYDPATFAWPMGRQGKVTKLDGKRVEVNIGSELSLKPGDQLILYDAREQVGRLQIQTVHPGKSVARVIQYRTALGDAADPAQAVGLTASEFTIPNQVVHSTWSWLAPFEGLMIALTLGLWLWSVVSPVPGQWVMSTAVRFATWLRELPPPAQRFGWVLLGIPFCLVAVQIVGWFWIAAPDNFLADMYALDQYLPVLDTQWIPQRAPFTSTVRDVLNDLPIFLAVGALIVWVFSFLTTDKNILWRAMDFVKFRRDRTPIYRLLGWAVPRGTLNWVLHLLVFYLFARNLFWFLQNNMTAAATAGWPGAGLAFGNIDAGLHGALYMLTHAPAVGSVDEFFVVARYLTWSACIVGCLVGYGHTILSILWKKEGIRWVDFTMMGFMANLLCYGAWSNAAFQVFPHPHGADPAIVAGPLYYLQPTTELYLNLIYTLSIFNMGTKFGVMVDKGMVTRGYYSVTRHPSYTLEPLMFSVLYLNRVTDPFIALGLLGHPFMYWWRSERDDTFMGEANPEYAEYREKVPWKYIPGVW